MFSRSDSRGSNIFHWHWKRFLFWSRLRKESLYTWTLDDFTRSCDAPPPSVRCFKYFCSVFGRRAQLLLFALRHPVHMQPSALSHVLHSRTDILMPVDIIVLKDRLGKCRWERGKEASVIENVIFGFWKSYCFLKFLINVLVETGVRFSAQFFWIASDVPWKSVLVIVTVPFCSGTMYSVILTLSTGEKKTFGMEWNNPMHGTL